MADFCMRYCKEAGGVGTNFKARASTSVSVRDSW